MQFLPSDKSYSLGRAAIHQPFFNYSLPSITPFFQPANSQQESENTEMVQTATENKAPDNEHEETLSNARLEVFKMFEILNNKGVKATGGKEGEEDPEFKAITEYTQLMWNKRKAEEKPWDDWRTYKALKMSYEAYLKSVEMFENKKLKKKPKEVKEPKFVPMPAGEVLTPQTTCILVATKVLYKAAQILKVKYENPSLMNPKDMDKSEAWHWAKPNMGKTERPKKGDIFILVKLKEKTTKAKTALMQARSIGPRDIEKLVKARDEAKKLLDEKQAANDVQLKILAALKDPLIAESEKPNKLQAAQAAQLVNLWSAPLKTWTKNLAESNKKLEAALNAVQIAEAKLMEARNPDQYSGQINFSHVGFFYEQLDYSDDKTKERWKTFDGGQHVDNEKKQGAKYVERIYDPVTNEIWGKPLKNGQVYPQDGETRWLLGWYDLDKLMKGPIKKN